MAWGQSHIGDGSVNIVNQGKLIHLRGNNLAQNLNLNDGFTKAGKI